MGINKDHFKKDLQIYIALACLFLALVFLKFLETCPLKILFGIPCPGCGLTRSYIFAFQGKFAEATSMHPFWIPITLLFIAFIVVRYLIVNEEKYKKCMNVIKILACVLVASMIAFYIYRMIVFYPNREPMVFYKKSILGRILQATR